MALYLSYLFRNGTATIPILDFPAAAPPPLLCGIVLATTSSNLLRAETPVDLGNLLPSPRAILFGILLFVLSDETEASAFSSPSLATEDAL